MTVKLVDLVMMVRMAPTVKASFAQIAVLKEEEVEKLEVLVEALNMMGMVEISSFRPLVSLQLVESSDIVGYFMVHK